MVSTIDEARTPAELAEWLRVWADGYEEGVDYLDDNDARQLAEAVERVCAPCNAAVMRAALEKAHNNIKKAREFIAWQTREDELLMKAQQEIKTALAAPAKNCDRFQTGDRLTDAVSALNAYANEEEHEPVRRWNESDWRRFLDWLFAPAKEGKEARRG